MRPTRPIRSLTKHAALAASAVALALTGLTPSAASTSTPWSNPRGDSGLSNFNGAESTISASRLGNLHRVWRTTLNSPGVAVAPLITPTRIVTLDNTAVVGFDLAGHRRWRNNLALGDHALFDFSPVVSGSTVLVAYRDGNSTSYLAGLRLSDGALLWKKQVVETPGTTANGVLYSNAPNALVARRVSDGRLLWRRSLSGGVLTPAYSQGRLYVPVNGGLQVRRASTGGLLWRYRLSGVDDVAVAGDVVIARLEGDARDGGLAAFDRTRCANPPCPPLWTRNFHYAINAFPTTTGNRVIVTTSTAFSASEPKLFVLGTTHGAIRWKSTKGGWMMNPTVGGGSIFVTEKNGGTLYAWPLSCSAATCNPKAVRSLGVAASPSWLSNAAVGQGRVVVQENQYLICYRE